jgi:hypothetical protein
MVEIRMSNPETPHHPGGPYLSGQRGQGFGVRLHPLANLDRYRRKSRRSGRLRGSVQTGVRRYRSGAAFRWCQLDQRSAFHQLLNQSRGSAKVRQISPGFLSSDLPQWFIRRTQSCSWTNCSTRSFLWRCRQTQRRRIFLFCFSWLELRSVAARIVETTADPAGELGQIKSAATAAAARTQALVTR